MTETKITFGNADSATTMERNSAKHCAKPLSFILRDVTITLLPFGQTAPVPEKCVVDILKEQYPDGGQTNVIIFRCTLLILGNS